MLIEPNRYLRALLRDCALRGGRVVIRAFGSAADLQGLDEPLIMNCTGLGAKELTGDTQLEPIRGQLSVLAPQPAIDYITLHGGRYMFPRTDGIILGGTFQHGNADVQPNAESEAQIVAEHAAFFAQMHT
jgi:glycine/D-amino acid oxidase-like deaminating enzyme